MSKRISPLLPVVLIHMCQTLFRTRESFYQNANWIPVILSNPNHFFPEHVPEAAARRHGNTVSERSAAENMINQR